MTTEKSPVSAPDQDCLVACLRRVARCHGIEFSTENVLAGLPGEGEPVAPATLVRAARRIGLRAQVVKRSLKSLPASVLPAILLLKGNRAGVLEVCPSGEGAEFHYPEGHGRQGRDPLPVRVLKQEYLGYAILFHPSSGESQEGDTRPEFSSAASRRGWFWRTAWGFRGYYLRLLPASLMINLFAVTMPVFVMLVYDRVVPNDAKDTLWVLAIGVTIVFTFEFFVRLLRGYVIERAGKEMDQVLSSVLFEHVMAIRMSDRPNSGSILAGRMKTYETLRQFFMSASLLALADLPFGLVMLGVIFYIGGPIGWILVVAMALAIIAELFIQLPMKRAVQSSSASSVERQAFISEAIGGIESVKAARAEGALQGRLERMMIESSKHEVRSHWFGLLGNSVTTFLLHLTSIAVVVASVYLVYAREMSMGAMIACVMLAARAMSPLAMVAALMTRLQQALASLRELNTVMNLPRESGTDHSFIHRNGFRTHYQLKAVSVAYPRQTIPALKGITLEIQPGERIALLGRVGSGKTSLLRLLSRLYDPSEGEALLDGINLCQYHPASVRGRIGYQPQDGVLFSGSIRDNVGLGRGLGLSDEVILRALDHAGLADFINRNPEGMHAEVGERGCLLSGGQRQAVVLARALAGDPRMLLLDEPTSGMDIQSEKQVLSALDAYFKEDRSRTLVVASHKLSVLTLVNRIIILDRGAVVADGPREAVLSQLREGKSSQDHSPNRAPVN